MTARASQGLEEPVNDPRSADLRDYWRAIQRRWALVVVLALVGAAAGLAYSQFKHSYAATAQVVVDPPSQGPLNVTVPVLQQVNIATEQAVAQSGAVEARAATILGMSAASLDALAAKHLSVSVPAQSNELQITWTASTASAAQRGANAFARAYLEYRHSLLAGQIRALEAAMRARVLTIQKQVSATASRLAKTSTTSSGYPAMSSKLTNLESQLSAEQQQLGSLPSYDITGGTMVPAALPVKPAGFGRSVTALAGLLLGLMIGMIAAVLRDIFDDRVRDQAHLDSTISAPTLAVQPGSSAAETVQALRATLVAMATRQNLRTIVLTGTEGDVSSSRITADLGVALAESGRKVLLIAADLHGSGLAQIFSAPSGAGLSDLLASGRSDVGEYAFQPSRMDGQMLPSALAGRLTILTSGHQNALSRSMLDSTTMTDLLASQREDFGFVLLDSPPATSSADALALAAQVDTVVVVARKGRTRGRSLSDLRRRLDQVGAHVIAAILLNNDESANDLPVAAEPGRRSRGSGRRRPAPIAPDSRSVAPWSATDVASETRPLKAIYSGLPAEHGSAGNSGAYERPTG